MSNHVTRDEAIRLAEQNAAQDRAEFVRRRSATRALAKKRAKAGQVRRGGSMTGGAAVGVALNQGIYRALRHSPGVAELLWDLGERVAESSSRQVQAHSTDDDDRHFVVDGKGGRRNNARASYRVAVLTRTNAARTHQHEDHILEAAITQLRGT